MALLGRERGGRQWRLTELNGLIHLILLSHCLTCQNLRQRIWSTLHFVDQLVKSKLICCLFNVCELAKNQSRNWLPSSPERELRLAEVVGR